MDYVRLTEANYFKTNDIIFNVEGIDCIRNSERKDVGCIVVSHGIEYLVRESFETVMKKLELN